MRETPDGLELVDGHLRAVTTPDTEVPVLILDITEAEADKMLATLDPLAGMATADPELLGGLLAGLETESDAVAALLKKLEDDIGPTAALGPELNETIADGVALCHCPTCGHEHASTTT